MKERSKRGDRKRVSTETLSLKETIASFFPVIARNNHAYVSKIFFISFD